MDFERLDRALERAIFGLVLAALVAGPLMLGGVQEWGFLVLQATTMGIMALWLARIWISPEPKLLWPPVCWVVAAFAGYAVARYCLADIEWVARKELLRVLVYAFLFFAILNNVQRQEYVQIIALTLVFLGMAISAYAIWQWVAKSQRIWGISFPYYPRRAGGTFVYPNQFATFLEMLIPLGACLALMGRISHLTKILTGYAVLVMLVGVGVTFSRGGWLVTGIILVATCLVLAFHRDYRLKALVLMSLLIVCGFFLAPKAEVLLQRTRGLEREGRVEDMRYCIWWSAIQMWRDNPWWGVGPGHFDYRFSQYRLPQVQLHAGYAHNDYLNTLADWGAAGMALIAAAVVLVYWGVFRCRKYVAGSLDDFARKKSNRLAVFTGAALGLLAVLLHSAVDFPMQLPADAILAITLMAILTGFWRSATERYSFNAGMMVKCLATLILLGGLAEFASAEWRGVRVVQCWRSQNATKPYTFERIEALKKTWAADNKDFQTAFDIGECYKAKSFLSESADPSALAREAIAWYRKCMDLDPYYADAWTRSGMCLDWIDEEPDTSRFYLKANALDPNGWFTTANTGWHYAHVGDYAAARTWFERSAILEWDPAQNSIAPDWLPVVERRLQEAALATPPGVAPAGTSSPASKP